MFCEKRYSEIYDHTPLIKFLRISFLSKATGNSPRVLLKMNSFTNIFQGFQTTELT